MGYLKSVATTIVYAGFVLAVITFIPGLPPDVGFTEYSIVPPKELSGQFAVNDRLNNAEKLFVNELKGPESFTSYNGQIYTGVHNGYIVRLDEDKIVPIVKFGTKCSGIWQEDKCGRVLGLQFNNKGELFAVDTYYGIYKVDVKTGAYDKIIDTSQPIKGIVPQIPNSLDIAKNGDIFWSDSSTDFKLYDGIYTLLADPTGRLIHYNVATKKNEVLIDGLAFANGVVLSDDETFVIVAETLASRIMKYYLKGPKAGQKEVFIEGLPGLPDNIHSDGRGGFIVSLVFYADSEKPQLPQSIMPHIYIRKLFTRLLAIMEAPLKLLQNIYPNDYAERLIHAIGSFESATFLAPKEVAVLRIDASGKIIDAAYATDGNIHGISSAYVLGGHLWLGSPFNEYVARVPVKKAFPSLSQPHKRSTETRNTKQTQSTQSSAPKSEKIDSKSASNSQNAKVERSTTRTAKSSTETPVKTSPTTTTTTTPKPATKQTTTTQAPKTVTPAPTRQSGNVSPPKATTATPSPTTTTTTQAPPVSKINTGGKPASSQSNPKPTSNERKSGSVEKQVKVESSKPVSNSEQAQPKLKAQEPIKQKVQNTASDTSKTAPNDNRPKESLPQKKTVGSS